MAEDEAGFEIDNSEPTAPGDRLRAAREAKGMSVDDVSAATRIPKRHLETIEDGDFAELPGRTYAIGFSRSYAKAVDLNEDEIVNEVRDQLGIEDPSERHRDGTIHQTEDPARLPSRKLLLASIVAAIVLIAGLFAFWGTYFDPEAGPDSLLAEEEQRTQAQQQAQAAATQSARQQPIASGPVVFTANQEVWVRFYDGVESDVLMESIMAEGDSYTIPDTADDPQIRTGQPYAFDITIGGQEVPLLGEDDVVISDVPVTAEALLTRDGVGLPAQGGNGAAQ
ncbi:helix-turn-helix domain-containing protein [Alteriqipengyuania lutimaris]|uniref:Helix-turn-helix domain-containing protein n=1 Tax=Alteriqipengyuania lutimaris TaxID=1538146 RepID=A0A395LP17_9SPHN|nr:helix-turn-helix domain-containing protein [Alteriqipengyuania lutimaris]MBB3033564.1 cytoskeletal protein RodZ [Alteriqipengyuania lutimaris]RDS78591.1 helix-turn-helix domain-containing protein [Alteriqipengyuania lutimaris]